MGYTRSACGGITERNSSLSHQELSGADSKMSAPLYVCLDTVPTALTGCGYYIYDSDKTLWFGVCKMYVKLTSVTFNGNLAHWIESSCGFIFQMNLVNIPQTTFGKGRQNLSVCSHVATTRGFLLVSQAALVVSDRPVASRDAQRNSYQSQPQNTSTRPSFLLLLM